MKEKPSAVKKLLKPQKGILRLVVEREVEGGNTRYLTSEAPPPSGICNYGIIIITIFIIIVTEILTSSSTVGASNSHHSLRELKSTGDIRGSGLLEDNYCDIN